MYMDVPMLSRGWTTDPPNRTGFYWAKWGDYIGPRVIQVIEDYIEEEYKTEFYIVSPCLEKAVKWHALQPAVRSIKPLPQPDMLFNAEAIIRNIDKDEHINPNDLDYSQVLDIDMGEEE